MGAPHGLPRSPPPTLLADGSLAAALEPSPQESWLKSAPPGFRTKAVTCSSGVWLPWVTGRSEQPGLAWGTERETGFGVRRSRFESGSVGS